jgi:undecaprenyl-diphosphatase
MVNPLDAMPDGAAARPLLLMASVLLAIGLWLHVSDVNVNTLLQVNAWGAHWPMWPSSLSVAGLGVSVFLLAGLAGPRHAVLFAATLLLLLGGGLVVQMLKLALSLPRPVAVLGTEVVQVVGISLGTRAMPSGHSAAAFALATLLCLLRPGRGWALLGLAFAAAVAVSRVAVGAHWPADVFVGSALGIVLAVALLCSARGRSLVRGLAQSMTGRAGSRVVAAMLVCAASSLWVAEREYPRAEAVHALLALSGLASAVLWWRWHPGVLRRQLPRRWLQLRVLRAHVAGAGASR